jgi:putative N6-adenine-specific DNA methylase
MIELAKDNAAKAWLAWEINFETKDFKDLLDKKLIWTLVSNPPYWERLKEEDLKWMYNNIDKLFRLNPELWGWIISSYMEFDKLVKKGIYKKRKLYNWGEKCYFWRRK